MCVVGFNDQSTSTTKSSNGLAQSVGSLVTIFICAHFVCVHSISVTHVSVVAVFPVYANIEPPMYQFHAVGTFVVLEVLIVVVADVISASWSTNGAWSIICTLFLRKRRSHHVIILSCHFSCIKRSTIFQSQILFITELILLHLLAWLYVVESLDTAKFNTTRASICVRVFGMLG